MKTSPLLAATGRKRIGVLGGTFNPPHLGHLRMAEELAQDYCLDEIMFIPSYLPPHKSVEGVAPASDRLEMTRLSCHDNKRFSVSSMEIDAGGLSYTVRTLELLHKASQAELFFILGADSLREIATWKDYQRLFTLANFLVASRPGITFADAWEQIPQGLREAFHVQECCYVHESGKTLIPTAVQGLDISATEIRAMVKAGKSIRYLVADSVNAYILQRGLYRR